MIAVADTSGLLALFNRSDPEHRATRQAADACGLLVVSPLSLAELDHVARIRAGRPAADTVLPVLLARAASGRVALAATTAELLQTAQGVRRRHQDLDLDLVDAVVVAVAAEYRTDVVLTLDRQDFRALRPLTGQPAFRLLPDDL